MHYDGILQIRYIIHDTFEMLPFKSKTAKLNMILNSLVVKKVMEFNFFGCN